MARLRQNSEIAFWVLGHPPKKGGDYSQFSQQVDEVKALLGAARAALASNPNFQPIRAPDPLRVEVTLVTPMEDQRGDTDNYLSGILDALQERKRIQVTDAKVERLYTKEELDTFLYDDDKQAWQSEIRYSPGAPTGYLVRVQAL